MKICVRKSVLYNVLRMEKIACFWCVKVKIVYVFLYIFFAVKKKHVSLHPLSES